ncbi:LOW QUALITY PROTEIN: interferon regulatory factor 3 [Rhinatrema bivittatum]|uniref:LOW QUALITY PROTEIN: interferon regulatory factor 3 n=1 Tax=Rhinatrema bivittatum TaxID=194408 RepID=UPI00112B8A24|nr:LOW QUALITY PROTEIN: interferon regulatory factor 3 [Rhinatrema bivittatum]
MGSQKPRILPWLLKQINSREFPGLSWTNLEHTEFSVPWKHGLRHDRSDEDFQIFEAWAIASGAYNPGTDKPNSSVWKRNFRSALNRKENICMIKDHSSDSNHPHKVYRILEGSDSQSPDSATAQELCHTSSPSHLCMEENLLSELSKPDLSQAMEEMHLMTESYPPYSAFQDMTSLQQSPPGPSPIFTAAASSREDPEICSPQSYLPLPGQNMAPLQPNPLEHFFPNQTLETNFEVSVFYRGHKVKSITVKNSRGFRLVACVGAGPLEGLEDVVLPDPSSLSDKEAVKAIQKLLDNLRQGLLLQVRGADICGTRLGKCHAYWTMTETPPTTVEPNEIAKGCTTLYTMQEFISDLIAFMSGTKKASPLYSMWLCLGELWPDPAQKPWTKKLIMVQVTPVVFMHLHEMSYSTGASSLQSSELNLQISDSLSSESLLWYLRDFEEKMDH